MRGVVIRAAGGMDWIVNGGKGVKVVKGILGGDIIK